MPEAKAWPKAGWILTILASGMFLMSATFKIMAPPMVIDNLGHLGWQQSQLGLLAALEIACVVLYLVPPLSVFGAIILTGFLGGAMATHIRVGEAVYMHVVLGLFIWIGLILREPRLRSLLPVRK